MSDSDPIEVGKSDELVTVFADAISNVKWKQWLLLFLVFILTSSDVFIKNALGNIPGAQLDGKPSNYGLILQGMFLVLAMIVIDMLVSGGVI